MKKRHQVAMYRAGAAARNDRGRPVTEIAPVEGGERIPVLLVLANAPSAPAGLEETPYGLIQKGRWLALWPNRGAPLPLRGDYLLAEPWGGPLRYQVEAVYPPGGRWDVLVSLVESAQAFGPAEGA